jgi:NhaC family Na+:H+ antiporter
MNIIILLLFVGVLIGFVIADISIVYALLVGYILFAIYAYKKGFKISDILKMSGSGILSAKNVLINFLLIGLLTALWRASGTIPSIVSYSLGIMHPSFIVVLSFLLCCLVSFLTGTAFGTSATMGVICMSVATAMGIEPMLMGGAIVSGAYFGDRCSPVSTSALLISELTETNLYDNIKSMFKTAAVPVALTCLIFTLLGFLPSGATNDFNVGSIFESEFKLGLIPLIPAVLILLLSFARMNVKITMLTSITAAFIICVFYQKEAVIDILNKI